MFRIIVFCFKTGCFILFILILGNTLQWKGKTLSENIRLTLPSAQNTSEIGVKMGVKIRAGIRTTLYTLRNWTQKINHESQKGAKKKQHSFSQHDQATDAEHISSEDIKKLKALINKGIHPSHPKKPSQFVQRNRNGL